MQIFYPMLLHAIPKYKIWGGSRLKDMYGKSGASDHTGETWELSVREHDNCVIASGEFSGLSLAEYISLFGSGVVSDSWDGKKFPILIKLIDAAENLSIQVHPTEEYAALHESDQGKNELWYIVDAEPGSEIVYGTKRGIKPIELREALDNGQIEELLNRVKVKPGDCFYVPAGLIHAIGRGIIIAEIQQNSDLTYRVYDYNRRDENGDLRELHVDKAFDVIHCYDDDEIKALRFSRADDNNATDPVLLAHCKYFKIKKLVVRDLEALFADASSFHSLLIVSGAANIICADMNFTVRAGDSVFIPAKTGAYTVSGDATLLLTTLG